MRILLVHNRYQRRGGEDVVFEAERDLLGQYGHEVTVYQRDNAEIETHSVWRRADLLRRTIWATDSIASIRKILERQRPQIVHFHNTFPLISPSAYSACVFAGVPVVQTVPNYRLICLGATLQRNGRPCELCIGKYAPWPGVRHACYRNSRMQSGAVAAMLLFHRIANTWDENVDRYIALTEFARRKLIEGGLPEGKIIVKPNFVHPDPGPRVADSGYALFVGRLSQEKGIGTLLRVWENLPGIPLKVVGDGPLRPQVEEAVARGNHVQTELLGFRSREEVFALMREARLLVFPSECYEGFPMALVEAFACGTPVVGSRIGSVEEVIQEGVSGLLFEPGDASEMTSAVQLLWSDPQLRHRLAVGARAQYEAHYTAEKNYKLIMKIFEDAITGKT